MRRTKSTASALIILVWLVAGCAGIGVKLPSVCDTLIDPSVLCDISRQMGVRLEDVRNVLIVANSISLTEGLYTKQQVVKVLTVLRDVLQQGGISYAVFKTGLYGYLESYPGMMVVFDDYLAAFGNYHQFIYTADRRMLESVIDEQLGVLSRMK